MERLNHTRTEYLKIHVLHQVSFQLSIVKSRSVLSELHLTTLKPSDLAFTVLSVFNPNQISDLKLTRIRPTIVKRQAARNKENTDTLRRN